MAWRRSKSAPPAEEVGGSPRSVLRRRPASACASRRRVGSPAMWPLPGARAAAAPRAARACWRSGAAGARRRLCTRHAWPRGGPPGSPRAWAGQPSPCGRLGFAASVCVCVWSARERNSRLNFCAPEKNARNETTRGLRGHVGCAASLTYLPSAERVSRYMHDVLVCIDRARSVWWCYIIFNPSVLPETRVLARRLPKAYSSLSQGATTARSPFYSRGRRAVNNGQDAALVAPGHVLAE